MGAVCRAGVGCVVSSTKVVDADGAFVTSAPPVPSPDVMIRPGRYMTALPPFTELWSPTTETWTTLANMQVPRLSPSTALLLPDGRVMVAGGGRNDGVGAPDSPRDKFSGEIYSPPYLFKGPRPTITSAPATTSYAANMFVATPDTTAIAAVSFIGTGSVTHACNGVPSVAKIVRIQ